MLWVRFASDDASSNVYGPIVLLQFKICCGCHPSLLRYKNGISGQCPNEHLLIKYYIKQGTSYTAHNFTVKDEHTCYDKIDKGSIFSMTL